MCLDATAIPPRVRTRVRRLSPSPVSASKPTGNSAQFSPEAAPQTIGLGARPARGRFRSHMAQKATRKVLHLSGRDSPSALTDFCRLLSQGGAKLLHLSQSSVHGCLVINAEIEEVSSDISEQSAEFARSRDMHLEITDLPAGTSPPARCGVWVT